MRRNKPSNDARINEEINSSQIRVIAEDGEALGVMTTAEALEIANERAYDLVEIAPDADPPVCKLMDYGKFKYQQSKRAHEAKKNQKIIHLKEIKLRPKTEAHDFDFKFKHAIEFLEDGDRVKVSVFFRGREMIHQDLGHKLLKKFVDQAEEVAAVEVPPKMEGRSLSMVLAPRKK